MADMNVGANGTARTTRTGAVEGQDACRTLEAMVKEGQKASVSPGDAKVSKEFDFAKINQLADQCREVQFKIIRDIQNMR